MAKVKWHIQMGLSMMAFGLMIEKQVEVSILWRPVIAMSGTVHKPLTSLYLLTELRAGVIMMP